MWRWLRNWLRQAPTAALPVTEERAIEIARDRAIQEGWPWMEPAAAVRMRPSRLGRTAWTVRSPGNVIGRGVWVIVDAKTGEIWQAGFSPR